MDPAARINEHIKHCLLPKLSRNFDEIDNHPEYYDRENTAGKHFPQLIDLINKEDLKEHAEFTRSVLPSLITLYMQRSCKSPWNKPICLEYADKLNKSFTHVYGVALEHILSESEFCNVQEVFDTLVNDLNKLVANKDLKKYPGLMEVYFKLIKNLKVIKVTIKPVALFPISLLLIDDHVNANKIRGLRCCGAIMHSLNKSKFQDGNYYEVIYSTLKKKLPDKNLEITKLVHGCISHFIEAIPIDVKKAMIDEIFGLMLEQIHLESNLHRKTECIGYVKRLMQIHQVDCVNKRLLKIVLYDNIHICCNDAVADILLVDLIECIQVWITHCWVVWKLSTDHKLLSALIKLLYVSRKESIATEIQEIIITLISLCSKDEQKKIYENLAKSQINTPEFREKIDAIKIAIYD